MLATDIAGVKDDVKPTGNTSITDIQNKVFNIDKSVYECLTII